MEVNPQRLREIIQKVLAKYQSAGNGEAGTPRAASGSDLPLQKVRAYAVCEKGKSGDFLSFLRECKKAGRYSVVVVPESPDRELIEALLSERLCDGFAGVDAPADPSVSCTLYPTFSRSCLAEAAMGMDYGFAAKRLRKDFEAGRKAALWVGGLDPFTGKEPEAYKELIVSHIRSLIRMGVSFFKTHEDLEGVLGGTAPRMGAIKEAAPAASSHGQGACASKPAPRGSGFELMTEGNLIFAKDLKAIPRGSTVRIPAGKVITPMAKDQIRDRLLKVVFA